MAYEKYQTQVQLPDPLRGDDFKDYYHSLTRPLDIGEDKQVVDEMKKFWGGYLHAAKGRFRVATQDIKGFKAVRKVKDGSVVIASLIIPEGAIIHWGGYADVLGETKMRATEARVVQLATRKQGKPVAGNCRSDHTRSFRYKIGETVKPADSFSYAMTACESGIHFFLNAADATAYLY